MTGLSTKASNYVLVNVSDFKNLDSDILISLFQSISFYLAKNCNIHFCNVIESNRQMLFLNEVQVTINHGWKFLVGVWGPDNSHLMLHTKLIEIVPKMANMLIYGRGCPYNLTIFLKSFKIAIIHNQVSIFFKETNMIW